MDRLTAMRVFVTVVDLGSQSAAADHLEMSRPVVSRYLAELEDWIGARLMHRTTRKLSLTAAGSETLPRCRQLLELSGDLQAAVRTPDEAPRGLLRISVSTSFGQAQFADAMTEYVRRFPGVNVDLQMLDRTVNLVDERIDLAIRASNDLDPNLIARRLTVCRSVICASPAYLREHPAPQRVEDLSRYNCLDALLLRQEPLALRTGRRAGVGTGTGQHQRQRGQYPAACRRGRRRHLDAADLPGLGTICAVASWCACWPMPSPGPWTCTPCMPHASTCRRRCAACSTSWCCGFRKYRYGTRTSDRRKAGKSRQLT